MTNDSQLDELIRRVNRMEEDIKNLQKPTILPQNEPLTLPMDRETPQGSDRSVARQKLIQIIQTKYPGLMVSVANRSEGGGVRLTTRSNLTYQVKFSFSQSYRENRLFAWFSINTSDIPDDKLDTKYDFYAMSVNYHQENIVFFFSNEELKVLLDKKKAMRNQQNALDHASNDMEHFYIEQIRDRYFDTREVDKNLNEYRNVVEGGIDVSSHFNCLDSIGKKIKPEEVDHSLPFMTTDAQVIKGKVYEILGNNSMVKLRRRDFFYSGKILEYIETVDQKIDFAIEESIREQVYSVVIHMYAGASHPIRAIHALLDGIKSKFGHETPIVFGLTMTNQTSIVAQTFLIGKKSGFQISPINTERLS